MSLLTSLLSNGGGGGGGTGDVVGPASSTDNAIARYDSTTGKLIQNSVVIVDDSGNTTGIGNLSASGNFTLSGLAKKIFGDFSNATCANRLALETSTVNGNTRVPILPNGTARLSGIDCHDGSDADNSSFLQLHSDGTNNHAGLNSAKVGTGTTKDLVLQIDSVTRAKVNAVNGTFQYLQPVNAQTGTTYTLVADDFAKLITINNASPVTITLPQQSTLVTTTGFFCKVRNLGVGVITFVKEGAETLDGNTTLNQFGEVLIERPTTTKWSVAYGTAIVIEQSTTAITGTLTNAKVYDAFIAPDNVTIIGFSLRNASATTAGTYTVAIDGTTVTGLSAIANSTTRTRTDPTALNTMTYQQVLTYTPAGSTLLVDAFITVFYTRSY
jgi:hypothetical protein